MTIRNFVPEIWSNNLLVALRKTLIYAGPGVVNRDYEGEIREAGDTVRITSVGRPSIGRYVPGQTRIVPEPLTTAQRTLVVDQADYWSFEVDDVDARQAKGTFMPEASDEAGYALADKMDQYVAGLYPAIPVSQRIRPVVIDHGLETAAALDMEFRRVYDRILVPMKVRLDELNVPVQGRYVVLPPWMHGALIRDSRFIENDKSADPSTLRNGQVGRAAGFDILSSNNTPVELVDLGADYGGAGVEEANVIQAGTSRAITWAEQINKTEAFRPESSFSDAIKGLALYGAKVIRPDSLVSALAVRRDTVTPIGGGDNGGNGNGGGDGNGGD